MKRLLVFSVILAGLFINQPLANPSALHSFLATAEANEASDKTEQQKELKLLLSLVWDGPSVDSVNLDAIRTFRQSFSTIPFTHFISPAYFTEGNTDSELNKKSIWSLQRPGDYVGINIAPWKSIVTKSGVIYRSSPTFWSNVESDSGCPSDCGNDVPLNIYSPEEIRKIMSESLRVMNTNGFPYLQGMQVQGWMATPEVLSVAEQAGISYDFSMITPSIVHDQLRTYPIFSWIKRLWPTGDILSQPGVLSEKTSSIVEIPQSLGSLDYVSHVQMLQFLDKILASPSKVPMTYHIVLNANTAHISLAKLEIIIQSIFKQASEGRFRLTMMNIPDMEWKSSASPMAQDGPDHMLKDNPRVH